MWSCCHVCLFMLFVASIITGGFSGLEYFKWKSTIWTNCTTLDIWSKDEICVYEGNPLTWRPDSRLYRNTAYGKFTFSVPKDEIVWIMKVGCGDNSTDAISKAKELCDNSGIAGTAMCPCGWYVPFSILRLLPEGFPSPPTLTIIIVCSCIVGLIVLFYLIFFIRVCCCSGDPWRG